MEELPYYPVATLGFRQWVLSNEEPFELLATNAMVGHCYKWNTAGVTEAIHLPHVAGLCRVRPPDAPLAVPPMAWCVCGIYALSALTSSLPLIRNSHFPLVGGIIAGWGKRELCETGFKCQKAKVMALFNIEKAPWQNGYIASWQRPSVWQENLEKMCEQYDIPLFDRADFLDPDYVRRYADERNLALLEDLLDKAPLL